MLLCRSDSAPGMRYSSCKGDRRFFLVSVLLVECQVIGVAGPKTLEDMDISFVQSQLQTAEHKVEHLTEVSFLLYSENCQTDYGQGSHRSGKSGNSGKILKTFSSQGNQGKTGGFQPKSGEKISNQGTFFPNHFQTI